MDAEARYFDEIMPSVPGWFYEIDAVAFRSINHVQVIWGLTGSLAEVGVYCGKALGLMATFRVAGEKLYGFDLFTGEASLEQTRDTLMRAVGDLSGIQLVTVNSLELKEAKLREIITGPVRFLHVDASHEYGDTLSDLRKFGALVGARGIIAVDDYYDRDYPGVCVAANDFIRESDFVPFLAGEIKIYLCRRAELKAYIGALLELGPFQQGVRIEHVRDQPMLVGFSGKGQARATLKWP